MCLAKELHFFSKKIELAAKKIVEQMKICDDSVKEKYDWTKHYIISSLDDDAIFSEEHIASLDESNRQPINIRVKYIGEEDDHGQP